MLVVVGGVCLPSSTLALEQALAQERAPKEAEMKAQADAAEREAIETERLRALEAENAQQVLGFLFVRLD